MCICHALEAIASSIHDWFPILWRMPLFCKHFSAIGWQPLFSRRLRENKQVWDLWGNSESMLNKRTKFRRLSDDMGWIFAWVANTFHTWNSMKFEFRCPQTVKIICDGINRELVQSENEWPSLGLSFVSAYVFRRRLYETSGGMKQGLQSIRTFQHCTAWEVYLKASIYIECCVGLTILLEVCPGYGNVGHCRNKYANEHDWTVNCS